MRGGAPAGCSAIRALKKQNPLSHSSGTCLTRCVQVDLGIWNKLTKVVVGLIVLAVLLLIARHDLPLIQENERMRREIYRLEAELQKSEQLSKDLKADIDALRNDPKTVERLAREKLGYARTNETIIRFESPQPETTSH